MGDSCASSGVVCEGDELHEIQIPCVVFRQKDDVCIPVSDFFAMDVIQDGEFANNRVNKLTGQKDILYDPSYEYFDEFNCDTDWLGMPSSRALSKRSWIFEKPSGKVYSVWTRRCTKGMS